VGRRVGSESRAVSYPHAIGHNWAFVHTGP